MCIRDRYRSALRLLVADDEHIRNFLQLRLTDLVADFFAALVDFNSHPRVKELLVYLPRLFVVALGDWQDAHLLRRKP